MRKMKNEKVESLIINFTPNGKFLGSKNMCDAEFGMHEVDHVYFFLTDFFLTC